MVNNEGKTTLVNSVLNIHLYTYLPRIKCMRRYLSPAYRINTNRTLPLFNIKNLEMRETNDQIFTKIANQIFQTMAILLLQHVATLKTSNVTTKIKCF